MVGGDWNCTLHFTLDRNGSEPHPQSAKSLSEVIKKLNLTDVWRDKNPSAKQYSWVKAGVGGVYSARLDRFYISKLAGNRVLYTNICPSALVRRQPDYYRYYFIHAKTKKSILAF